MPEDQQKFPLIERMERLESALQRIEQRLARVELNLNTVEPLEFAPTEEPAGVMFEDETLQAIMADAEDQRPVPTIVFPPTEEMPVPATPPTEPPPADWRTEFKTTWEPPRPQGDPSWIAFLRKIKVMPPRDSQMSMEMLIGSWWLPRVAVLLGVIGIVWLAVYFSRSTPPPLRFAGILSASIGISVLGYLMERRGIKDFGSVLFGTGLAMVFFTVFAGYAFEAVRVFHTATVAAGVQFAVIVAIAAIAFIRRSHTVASLAVFLGYVACFFSFAEQLHAYSLAAAFLLAVAACFFYLSRDYHVPYLTAIPGAYLIYACILVYWTSPKGAPPPFLRGLAFPFAAMLLFGAADYLAYMRASLMPQGRRVFAQLFSSTAAVGLGYLATRQLYPQDLAQFYFAFGGVLTAASLLYWFHASTDGVMQGYFVKGTALLTLGLIEVLVGHQRWLALLGESFVLLFAARRSRLLLIETASVFVWYASLYYCMNSLEKLLPGQRQDWTSTLSMLSILYLLGSTAYISLHGRLMEVPGNDAPEFVGQRLAPRDTLLILNCALAGMVGVTVLMAFGSPLYLSLAASILALACAALALPLRHWAPPLVGALIALYGFYGFFHAYFHNQWPLRQLWINAASLMAVSLAALGAMEFIARRRTRWSGIDFLKEQTVVHLLWFAVLHFCFTRTFDAVHTAWLADMLAVFLMAAASVILRMPSLAAAAVFPLLIIAGESLAGYSVARKALSIQASIPWGLLILLPFVYAVAATVLRPLRERLERVGSTQSWEWLHLGLAAVIAHQLFDRVLGPSEFMFALAAGSVAIALLRLRPGMKAATAIAIVYLGLAHVEFYSRPQAGQALLLSILTAVATLAHPLLIRRCDTGWTNRQHAILQYVTGASALALLYSLFLRQTGEMRNYITIFWGISSCAVFMIGLMTRMKSLRIVGLLGLALCLPRLFFVDIRSTVYRIGAFIVLCIVLLVVGYIYNRFRSIIERAPEKKENLTEEI